MSSVDFARWTTTLTASYLAITAALIAILGTTIPARVWLVGAPDALRVVADAEPREAVDGDPLLVNRTAEPTNPFHAESRQTAHPTETTGTPESTAPIG